MKLTWLSARPGLGGGQEIVRLGAKKEPLTIQWTITRQRGARIVVVTTNQKADRLYELKHEESVIDKNIEILRK